MLSRDQIITGIIQRESPKYTNDPNDKGGPTKFGITLNALRKFRNNPNLTADDVKNLTEVEARLIYERNYIINPGYMQINYEPLRVAMIDFGVTSGADDSIPTLQKIIGVKADGQLGPKTAAAANALDGRTLCNKYSCARAIFYADLAQKIPSNLKYVEGWVARALSFVV